MNLAAGIIFYQDCKSLKRCLDSLPACHVNHIFCIDGRFPDFKGETDFSTDGSIELVRSYPHTEYVPHPGPEEAKRNKYLELAEAQGFDWIIVIDCDEYISYVNWEMLKMNLDLCPKNLEVYMTRFKAPDPAFEIGLQRLIRVTGKLEYFGVDNLRDKVSGKLAEVGGTLDGLMLSTDDTLRDANWLEQMCNYEIEMAKSNLDFCVDIAVKSGMERDRALWQFHTRINLLMRESAKLKTIPSKT